MPTVFAAAVAAVVFLCSVPAAFAQARSGYPAVFGGATSSGTAETGNSLLAAVDLTEAYDDDLLADSRATPQPSTQVSGVYTSFIPQLSVRTHGRRVQFMAHGDSSLRHYPSFATTLATNHNLDAGFAAQVGQTTRISANQTGSYAPAFLYGLFAGPPTQLAVQSEPAAGAADYQSSVQRSYTYVTNAAVTHAAAQHVSLSFNGSLRKTDFVGDTTNFSDMRASELAGRLAYKANRDVTVRIGYGRHDTDYLVYRTTEHDAEFGVDWSHSRSATRQSTFGFTVVPARLQLPAADFTGTAPLYRVLGDAYVQHQMGRSWSARAFYRRGLAYIETLSDPVYTDSANVEVAGFVHRRIDLFFSASYATGEVASPTASAAEFKTYAGYSRLRIGLNEHWAVRLEGLFYEYAFDPSLVIVPGTPSHFERAGVRAGMTVWLPVKAEERVAR